MATITIRDFPDAAEEALRVQAAQAGVSLEAFARGLLQATAREAKQPPAPNLLLLSRQIFGMGEGVDLELPARHSSRQGVDLDS